MTLATPGDVADVETIRHAFPRCGACARNPVAYFDGPGGTQVPQAVVDAVDRTTC
mgnify:CR=1 FL=1